MLRRIFSAVWLTVAAVSPGFAAGETAVQMSPYEVSANSVAFEHWAKYSSPHFIVYSDASPEEAMRALNEFEFLHLAAVKYFNRPAFLRAPTIVVLPTERSDWRKLESTAAVEWHVAVSTLTLRLQGLALVGYNWQGWLNGGDNLLLSALGSEELTGMKIEGPLWFRDGSGRFFEKTQFEDDAVTVGKLSTTARSMWMHRWLPWSNFFKATGSSPEFTKKDNIRSFVGQSAAFVHYLLTEHDPIWRDRLMKWAAMLQAGREPTEEAFKDVFGQDWAGWQKIMEKHIHDHSDKTVTIPLTVDERNYPRTRLELPPREMRELFVLAQILNQKKPASEAALDSLLAKGLKSEALRELLVEACGQWKRFDAEEEQLQVLLAANTPNPMVAVVRAGRLFRREVPTLKLDARLADGTDEIRRLCGKALELEPWQPDAINLLAWTEALGPTVTPENVAALEKMNRDLRGRVVTQEIVAALAIAQWRAGNLEAARQSAQALADSLFVNKRMKELAAALLRELDASR